MNRYDAVIAGGGLIGASIAFELASAGLQVALYDAREPGREASWASAGMISPAPENAGMIPFMPMSLASVALYPEFIRKVEELTGRDAGHRYRAAARGGTASRGPQRGTSARDGALTDGESRGGGFPAG